MADEAELGLGHLQPLARARGQLSLREAFDEVADEAAMVPGMGKIQRVR